MKKDNKITTSLFEKSVISNTKRYSENKINHLSVELSEVSKENNKVDVKDNNTSKIRFGWVIFSIIFLCLIVYRIHYLTSSELESSVASKDNLLSVSIIPKSALMEIQNEATMHTTTCGSDCQLFMNSGEYTVTIYAKDYEPLTRRIKVSEDTELSINMELEGTLKKQSSTIHTQKDIKAVAWFKKSAEKGNSDAMYNLGRMYQLGRGVDRDMDLALQWMKRAAKSGNLKAKDRLQKMNLDWD
ncbi:PEGA domain-containing protein [Vibrio breoganii]|uniref:PEGA domain-containing protein n=1 Tax=Vibrio breoganii TaxID=553239 RepID=UPI0010BE0158|nr:PEGA domain-containing protein [Vibrio breoganii]TKG15358.1 PEGA domain-containing protein [Vibrio breoganii]